MLFNVSNGLARMALNVIRNHPNAWSVQVFRKVIDRTAPTSTGGLPTIGGIGTLDSQDEPAYHYEFLVNACAVRADQFQGGGLGMTERMDAPMGGGDEFPYLIAPEMPSIDEPEPAEVEFKTKDVVLFLLGDTVDAARLAFEVATIEPTMDMPPYLPRYILNRRSDLNLALSGAGP